ncbi:hypothetical protein Rsub_07498 [Raphidocelis subcapitata]|uniref:Uncharacterized protein n=1 Tax=Raphidocelis subcapitata TaxID=307507 RepID=A0A2V0PCV4_9CHLO|nr:hypothetical protein Rsub_07498 [Raphidocelis subcapitata]|eukprot:GBF94997.1 hypothetical protein Rsub_07498 [Raphidocelis subcapitata]
MSSGAPPAELGLPAPANGAAPLAPPPGAPPEHGTPPPGLPGRSLRSGLGGGGEGAGEDDANEPDQGGASGSAAPSARKRSRKPLRAAPGAATPEPQPAGRGAAGAGGATKTPAPRPPPAGPPALPGMPQRKKRKMVRGNAARGRFAQLKGAMVNIPGQYFNVGVGDADDILFRAVVVGRDNTHSGCLTVRFKHWRERFFFPLEQIEDWMRENADAPPATVHDFASWPGNETSRMRVVRTYNPPPGAPFVGDDGGAGAADGDGDGDGDDGDDGGGGGGTADDGEWDEGCSEQRGSGYFGEPAGGAADGYASDQGPYGARSAAAPVLAGGFGQSAAYSAAVAAAAAAVAAAAAATPKLEPLSARSLARAATPSAAAALPSPATAAPSPGAAPWAGSGGGGGGSGSASGGGARARRWRVKAEDFASIVIGARAAEWEAHVSDAAANGGFGDAALGSPAGGASGAGDLVGREIMVPGSFLGASGAAVPQPAAAYRGRVMARHLTAPDDKLIAMVYTRPGASFFLDAAAAAAMLLPPYVPVPPEDLGPAATPAPVPRPLPSGMAVAAAPGAPPLPPLLPPRQQGGEGDGGAGPQQQPEDPSPIDRLAAVLGAPAPAIAAAAARGGAVAQALLGAAEEDGDESDW